MRRGLVAMLLALPVCGLVALAGQSIAFHDLEFWGYDFLVNHGGYSPPSQHVVVVDFDDATFGRLQQYPIPRKTVAEVISRISAGAPRVVGLDLFLSEARSTEEDAAFQRALADAGNVIVASQAGAGGIPGVKPLPMFCEAEQPELDSGFCREGTSGALAYAFVNLKIESDGFVRRFYLFSSGTNPVPSFSATVAGQYAGQPVRPLAADRVSFLGRPIRYADAAERVVWIGAWNPALARRVAAIDLLDGKVDASGVFRDKLVLVGQSHDAARDRFFTPLFRPEPEPRLLVSGVEVHAAAIETLLTGRPIVALPDRATWALLFVLSAAAVSIVLWLDLGPASLAIVAALAATYGAAQIAYSSGHLWVRYMTLGSGVVMSVPVGLAYRFVQEKILHSAAAKEREQIMGLFGRYVSPDVAQEIWTRREEVVLGGEERVATVLFSDIRSFTAMTAGRPSHAVLQWLNAYLTAMDEVIREHGGFLNKFIGDGIMVLFGVPLSEGMEADATRAVRAALAMLDRLETLNRTAGPHREFGILRIGIGLHTGKLTCGNVGSNTRLEYSVIGETVNLASRLESLTKDFHTPIVMSQATADAIRQEFPGTRDLGETVVRGFAETIHLHTIDSQAVAREA